MKKIEKTIDILFAQMAFHVRSSRGLIFFSSFLLIISFGLSKLPYFNLFLSPQIVLMIGMFLLFILFPRKVLYILFVALLCLFTFYTITGGVINDILQNAFFILVLVVVLRPIFRNAD